MDNRAAEIVRRAVFGEAAAHAGDDDKRCSAFAAGKKATVDGSTLNCYTCDGPCDFRLQIILGGDHPEGTMHRIDYVGIPGGQVHTVFGAIPEAAHTHSVFSVEVPVANDRQVFISENTCGSKTALSNKKPEDCLMDYYSLAAIMLQRASTAAQGVSIMAELVEKYGMRGPAESFIISDPDEIWNIEIVGNSTLWVAERIPEDAVIFHANRLRIQEIDFHDPENFRWAKDLVTWAEQQGFYDKERDGEFSFERVYSLGRGEVGSVRREWRATTLLCPSEEYKDNAGTYPYYLRPENKVSAAWVMQTLFRDVYEGTQYDLTKDLGGGPFGDPIRQKIKGIGRERPIGIASSAYSTVAQARSWLPAHLGGLLWYCHDTSRVSCWTPIYCGTGRLPASYGKGDYIAADPASSWWVVQTLETLSELRYDEIHADIRRAFDVLEAEQLKDQPKIEEEAKRLYEQEGEEAMTEYLTRYTNERCTLAEAVGRQLIAAILVKYIDGSPKRETISEEWRELLSRKDPQTYFEFDWTLEYKTGGRVKTVTVKQELRPEDAEILEKMKP